MNCLLFLSVTLRYLSQHRQSTHRVMTACKIALEPTQTQTQIDALGVTKLLKLFFKQEDMDETKGRTNAQRSKVSSGLRFFFGVKSAVGLRFITSIVATHLHNDGGNTHTETYNLADKRSRTREGVNLQCESVKFFFCSLQYLSSDVSATTAATVVATVTSVVPGWKQKLYLPANFHVCASGHTHTLKA